MLLVFVWVPGMIAASGRWDLYYTLTSVALLSIGAAGVWLTFYIGRINIGQGAYALMGGYVSAVLSFYLLAVTLMALTYAALWRIVNSQLGHLCRSLQQQ